MYSYAPWYIRNNDLNLDLGILSVKEQVNQMAGKHETKLHVYTNVQAVRLLKTLYQ